MPVTSRSASACPGCGLLLPREQTADATPVPHAYMTGSPACWSCFTHLLAAQYADPARMAFHQLVVDAYAVQHPGDRRDRRAVQSVGIHLMTLCLFCEYDADPAEGTRLHRRMVSRPVLTPLAPPISRGELSVLHVPTGGPSTEARSAAWEWACCAWQSWSAHHDVVRTWLLSSGMISAR